MKEFSTNELLKANDQLYKKIDLYKALVKIYKDQLTVYAVQNSQAANALAKGREIERLL